MLKISAVIDISSNYISRRCLGQELGAKAEPKAQSPHRRRDHQTGWKVFGQVSDADVVGL